MKKKRCQKVIFIETLEDVLVQYDNIKKNDIIIGLTPSVRVALKEMGVQSRDTLSYFTDDSHKNILTIICEIYDWLRKESNFVSIDLNLSEELQETFLFYVYNAVSNYLRTIELVSNIRDNIDPKIISASIAPRFFTGMAYVDPREKSTGVLTKKICTHYNIPFEGITTSYSIFDKVSWIKEKSIMLAKHLMRQILMRARCLTKSVRPVALFTTQLYNFDDYIKTVQKNPADVFFELLPGPHIYPVRRSKLMLMLFRGRRSFWFRKQKKLFDLTVNSIKRNKALFSYREIDFSDVLIEKIERDIMPEIYNYMIWAGHLNYYLDKIKPKVVLSSANREDDVILASLCKNKKISNVLISHATHVVPKKNADKLLWDLHAHKFFGAKYSHIAVQSRLTKELLELNPRPGKPIPTGPVIWKKHVRTALLHKTNHKDERVILYASTPKLYGHVLYHAFETVDEYIDSVQKLCEAIKEIPNVKLIIKHRSSPNTITDTDMQKLIRLPQNASFNFSEPIHALLKSADLLISFSSASIEEAIQCNVPVLLYGGRGRYQHIDATDIANGEFRRSAVYFVKDDKNLKPILGKILSECHTLSDEKLYEPYHFAPHEITDLFNHISL